MTSLFTFGETMGLVAADGIGPLPHARGFSFGIGGAESDVAVGVARLGGAATWLGAGSDGTRPAPFTPALSATARATVFQSVETARADGVPVSVDVNYRAS